jgi:hypothetical protein
MAAATDTTSVPPLSRRRRLVVWALVVVASVIAVVSLLTTWVNRQMLDNHSWQKASEDLIQDPEVQSALSVYLVNQLYANVDVAGGLEQRLPKNLKPLAAPLSAALREPTTRSVNRLLTAPRVQQLWVNASVLAHDKLVNVLENKTGHGISTGDGVVTLDLSQLVKELAVELGLPAAALEKIPANAGVINVMSSDQLSAAQAGVQAVHVLSVWLLVLVLALYALAIYLARGARRETLRNVGWAFVIVGLIAIVVRRVVGNYAVDALAAPGYEKPVGNVWLIASSILAQIGWALVLYGVVAVLGATLAGPHGYAVAARRRIAPYLVDRPGFAWGAVGIAFLLLIFWGGTHALRTWWGILLLAALLALGVEALRRQVAQERELAVAPQGLPPEEPTIDAGHKTVLGA